MALLRLPGSQHCVTLSKNTVSEVTLTGDRKKVLGCRLRAARLGAGQSQGGVAEMLGVTRQSVSAWETGASSPSAVQLGQLSAAYCVCAHTLLFGEPFKPLVLSEVLRRPGAVRA